MMGHERDPRSGPKPPRPWDHRPPKTAEHVETWLRL